MSEKWKRDILIHFNESGDELIIYTVATSETTAIRHREFDGGKTDLAWFQSKQPDEAEKDLGAMIFSLLDTFSQKRIGIRDYRLENEQAHEEYVVELRDEAESGSAEAKYHLSNHYHYLALSKLDSEALKRAEDLLIESASLGFTDAIERLNGDWKIMKEAVIRKIERESNP